MLSLIQILAGTVMLAYSPSSNKTFSKDKLIHFTLQTACSWTAPFLSQYKLILYWTLIVNLNKNCGRKMWHQIFTRVVLILILQSCGLNGIFQQSFYSTRKGYKVRSRSTEIGNEKADTILNCAQICRHTEGCLAADNEFSLKQCQMYESFHGYDGGEQINSALVLYGSCPNEEIGRTCECFFFIQGNSKFPFSA